MATGETGVVSNGNGDCPSYEPNSILITGGAGFIGSHVVLRLLRNYPAYKVVVLDKLDYCASLRNLREAEGNPQYKFVKGDIQSADLLSFVLQTENIDTVMHFAAQTHVDNSFGNSLTFTMNNTYGTHVLLESCRVYGKVKRFLNVSTDEVYGESSLGSKTALSLSIAYQMSGLDETSKMEPTNPYSAAKAGAEMLARAYITSYNMPIIITRGNNVYGPHQFPEKMIPKFTLLASRGADLPVHGDGKALRSFLYVEDVAYAFDVVLHAGVTGETYNIGTQKERSVIDVAKAIAKVFKMPEERVVHVKDRAFNDRRYYICDDKLSALGWTESTPWEEGLRKTIDWYLYNGFAGYWADGEVELALQAHPTVRQSV